MRVEKRGSRGCPGRGLRARVPYIYRPRPRGRGRCGSFCKCSAFWVKRPSPLALFCMACRRAGRCGWRKPSFGFSVGGFVFSVPGIQISVPGFDFSVPEIENSVPGFGKPVAATRNPKLGNILLYAPPVRRAFDTRNRLPITEFCQARIPKPPPYQEKCRFFEKISMKGLAISNPCPTFALAKRNKAHHLPLSNAL